VQAKQISAVVAWYYLMVSLV